MNIEQQVRRIWPDWEIVKRIGEGSFGTVYSAQRRDSVGISHAAIKVAQIPGSDSELDALRSEGFTPEQSNTYLEGVVRDLTAEIRMMEAVKGRTNVVNIEDYKVVKDLERPLWRIFIRMELLTPLEKLIPLTEAQTLRLGMDLCTALSVCRRNNIVHRDIKPENIFANRDGDYKLGDFGVARQLERLTTGITRKGTYNYMAPEVFNNALSSGDIASVAKVDIYSLGIVLYRLSNNNRLPFIPLHKLPTSSDREEAVLRRMRGEPLPPPCNVSEGLARIVLKACAFDPVDRYETAEDMREALSKLKTGLQDREASEEKPAPEEPVQVPAAPVKEAIPPRQGAPIRRRKRQSRTRLVAAITAVALLLAAGIVWKALYGVGQRSDGDVVVQATDRAAIAASEPAQAAASEATMETAPALEAIEALENAPVPADQATLEPGRYVRIIGSTIKVRLTPGTGTDVFMNPADGTMFKYLNRFEYDKRGVAYYYIDTDEGPGYVTSGHTEIVDETGEYAEMDFMGKAVIAETDLPIRSEPDADASILGTVPKKERAKYLKEYRRVESGNKWFKVEYGGVTGWVWGLLCAMTIYE